MPTKRNRAGQQQNYVPQGNGDASGEYADQASGSNKHFANFKKPDEENVKSELTKTEQPEKEDTSKYLGGSKEKADFSASVFSKGMGAYGEDFKKDFKEIIANANEECIGILNHAFKNYKIDFIKDENRKCSYFSPANSQISIKLDELKRPYDEDGETVFHELGHYINESFKTTESEKWYSTENGLTDTHKFFEDKKSVTETLQEEIKEFAASKIAPKIRAARKKYINERLKPYGFTLEEYDRDVDKSNSILRTNEEWLRIRQRVVNDWQSGIYPTVADANRKLNEELQYWKENGAYKDLFARLDERRPAYRKFNAEWGKKEGIKAVSDVWSSKSDMGFGFGHPRSYYNKSSMNPEPEKLVADELFANFFAALSVSNNKVLETTQKYFPRTYEKMVKLVEILKDKKSKYEEMGKAIERFQRGEAI